MSSLWRFPAQPESVAAARRVTREFAEHHGADDDALTDITLCISEAVTNAVAHAYGAGGGELEIEAFDEDGSLSIHVRDFGIGLRPRADSPGAGYGLSVINQLASAVEVNTSEPAVGTELVMHFARAT